MDAGKLLVLVMTLMALAVLVWFELQSRKNNRTEKEPQAAAQPSQAASGTQATAGEISGRSVTEKSHGHKG